jgi:hypothetical protein
MNGWSTSVLILVFLAISSAGAEAPRFQIVGHSGKCLSVPGPEHDQFRMKDCQNLPEFNVDFGDGLGILRFQVNPSLFVCVKVDKPADIFSHLPVVLLPGNCGPPLSFWQVGSVGQNLRQFVLDTTSDLHPPPRSMCLEENDLTLVISQCDDNSPRQKWQMTAPR